MQLTALGAGHQLAHHRMREEIEAAMTAQRRFEHTGIPGEIPGAQPKFLNLRNGDQVCFSKFSPSSENMCTTLYLISSDIKAPRSGTHARANLNGCLLQCLALIFSMVACHRIEIPCTRGQPSLSFVVLGAATTLLHAFRGQKCLHSVSVWAHSVLHFFVITSICLRFHLPGGRYFWCLFCGLFSESAHRKRKIMFKATSSSRVVRSGLDICIVCSLFFMNTCSVPKESLRTPAIPFRREEREGKSERGPPHTERTSATPRPTFQTCGHSREREDVPRTERTYFCSVRPF